MMASHGSSSLLSSLPSSLATTNHHALPQMANGTVSNLLMLPSQQPPAAGGIFPASSVQLNGAYFSGESPLVSGSLPPNKATFVASSANTTNSQVSAGNSHPTNDATLAILMDRLYSKSNQMKSWNDLSKSLKQSLLEKRPFVNDNNDKVQLQRALDTMQNNIEVKSVQSMVERLDTICRQLKLKFSSSKNKNYDCFVSSDMYYVEIKLDKETGRVLDCNVAHSEAPQKSCPELVEILQNRNFIEFTKHLEGLSAIYQIDNDKKLKAKSYLALHSLEGDLSRMSEAQKESISNLKNMIHRTPVGVLEPRKGGYPMKTTFFVAPYDLIDLQTKSTLPLTVDTILERKIGYSAEICIEESPVQHKLQVEPLCTLVLKEDGKKLPQVAAHTASNTSQLPAAFVLKLAKPLPICLEQAHRISKITGIEFPNIAQASNLITLIASQCLPGQNIPERSTAFYARLPGQNHCYYVNGSSEEIKGILIEKVAFTHPSHVPRILVHLRHQVWFNVTIASIIRQMDEIGPKCHIFEIAATDLNNIYVQFELPIEQSLATLDIDLKEISGVKCKLFPSVLANICPDDYVSKIMQKSFSIPITMRSIINKAQEAANKLKEAQRKENASASAPVVICSNTNGTTTANSQSENCNGNAGGGSAVTSHVGSADPSQSSKQPQAKLQTIPYINQFGGKSANSPSLTPQQQGPKSSKNVSPAGNTMLMSMLSDTPHAAQAKICKKRKRLSSSSVELLPPSPKVFKQEPADTAAPTAARVNSTDMSSTGSISSSDNDHSTEEVAISSIKQQQQDDGLNEQMKIIKSLEEIQAGKEPSSSSSTELPKLILKNIQEKSTSSIKISKSQTGKSTVSEIQMIDPPPAPPAPPARKDRKRKRTDSFETKDSLSALLGGPSSGTSHLDLASSSSKAASLVTTSSSTSAKMISPSSLSTPPKLKKSNSTGGTSSSSTTTSPVTSPSIGKNLQLANNNFAMKVGSIGSSKAGKQSGPISLLSANKMTDFEAAAALAVAASSGGSQAIAAAAAAAAVSNFDKRFVKPKAVGSTSTTASTKLPITLSVTPSSAASATSANASTSNRSKTQIQSLVGAAATATAIKQKSSSGVLSASSSASLSLTSPKQIQTSISSQPILQQSSTLTSVLGTAVSGGGALVSGGSNQKGQSKPVKKGLGSLTAVVDRLRQNASGDGGSGGSSAAALAAVSLSGGGGTQAGSSAEISSATSAASRADSSSSTKSGLGGSSSKSGGSDKSKYSRNLDSQFTIKTQSNSGLKMSIAKTKLAPGQSSSLSSSSGSTTPSSASTTSDLLSKIGPGGTGLFKSSTNTKYTIPKIPKTSQAPATSSSASSLATISGAITSPTLSSSTSAVTATVGSSAPKTTKPSNVSKLSGPAGGKLPHGGPASKVSPKNPKRSVEKVFKNPDLPPPGGFTKLGQMPINRSGANLANLLKSTSGTFAGVSMAGSWSQPNHSDLTTSSKTGITSSSDPCSASDDRVGASVSSSSDVSNKSPHMPTSTPSSPVESPSMMVDPLKNPPPIIPTEAIDDLGSSSSQLGKSVDSSGSEAVSRLVSADSSSSSSSSSTVQSDLHDTADKGLSTKRKTSDPVQVFFPPGGKGTPGGDVYPNPAVGSKLSTQSSVTSEKDASNGSNNNSDSNAGEPLIGSSDS